MSDQTAVAKTIKRLDVKSRLEYALAAVSVLRSLQITDRTMKYKQFAQAIGLISLDGEWEAWHQQQVPDILRIVAAVERQAGGKTGVALVEFERIVNADGQPGAGVTRDTRIVSTPRSPVDPE
ncbi:hypothetical protein [Methylobacterium sp. 391_Methyba4]|uniref:hypothetical protein n=1 Tax=Methylobacterium sp. 391_Methyba4 TaxID=3038924 RepID=UPI00241D0D35|nr:hypothetical protein [Methylobacterium sp. 391_Methyba4]WFS09108.1 hypothetical protein P9K36_07395 [Methylobacterium sp. 391_Methyba4]